MIKLLYAVILVTIIFIIIKYQSKLSKHKNKWIGLIIPLISLVFSLIFSLASTPTSSIQSVSVQVSNQNEEIIDESYQLEPTSIDIPNPIPTVLISLFYLNIFTIILIITYLFNRIRIKKSIELENTHLQDI